MYGAARRRRDRRDPLPTAATSASLLRHSPPASLLRGLRDANRSAYAPATSLARDAWIAARLRRVHAPGGAERFSATDPPGRRRSSSPALAPASDPAPPARRAFLTDPFFTSLSSFFRFHSGTVCFIATDASAAWSNTPRNRWIPGLSSKNAA